MSEIEHILAEHGTTAEMYAHASAGCLHIRPLLDLQTLSGVRDEFFVTKTEAQAWKDNWESVQGDMVMVAQVIFVR